MKYVETKKHNYICGYNWRIPLHLIFPEFRYDLWLHPKADVMQKLESKINCFCTKWTSVYFIITELSRLREVIPSDNSCQHDLQKGTLLNFISRFTCSLKRMQIDKNCGPSEHCFNDTPRHLRIIKLNCLGWGDRKRQTIRTDRDSQVPQLCSSTDSCWKPNMKKKRRVIVCDTFQHTITEIKDWSTQITIKPLIV